MSLLGYSGQTTFIYLNDDDDDDDEPMCQTSIASTLMTMTKFIVDTIVNKNNTLNSTVN